MSLKYRLNQQKPKQLIKKPSLENDENFQHFKNNYKVIQLHRPTKRQEIAKVVGIEINREVNELNKKIKGIRGKNKSLLAKAQKINTNFKKSELNEVNQKLLWFNETQEEILTNYVHAFDRTNL